jgi:ThiF family
MVKQPTEELRAGRRALDGIAEVEILRDWVWFEAEKLWGLYVALRPKLTPTEFIPAITPWYLVASDRYPQGDVKLYPAKQDGITATFQHQSLNLDGEGTVAWRTGDLCLATNFKQLGHQGYDFEPRISHERLRWNIQRALEWLTEASQDRVAGLNEPFELPQIKRSSGLVAFQENTTQLERWNNFSENFGLVQLSPLNSELEYWHTLNFSTHSGKTLIENHWGTNLSPTTSRDSIGIWIRLPQIPVVKPWRFPATWGELREVFKAQNVDFDSCCSSAAGLSLRDGKPHLCLIGFPIPERVGHPPTSMCWQSIQLPKLTAPHSKGGFKSDPHKLWSRDRETSFSSNGPITWITTENWDKKQIQTRGVLPTNWTEKKTVVLGAGAIGSSLAELLVRSGVHNLTVVDADFLRVGNLSRHTLTMQHLGKKKATSLAARLNAISPYAKVVGVGSSIAELDEKELQQICDAEVVWECTANDDVLSVLEHFAWKANPIIHSVSVSFGAKRLFLYSQRAPLKCAQFVDSLKPWLDKDLEERGDEELPRDGIGCYHPVFPASAADIDLMVGVALKAAQAVVGNDPVFQVFERTTENEIFTGVRKVG